MVVTLESIDSKMDILDDKTNIMDDKMMTLVLMLQT